MADLTVSSEPLPGAYHGLGGRGLTSAVVSREVPPRCSPLGARNKLVFAPGLLGGTRCPNSGRISVGAKSPLTQTIKESNSGGQAGQYLSRLGIGALVVEGLPEDDAALHLLHVGLEGARLLPANDLKGCGNYDTAKWVKEKYGDKIALVSIGPAGEHKMASASVAFTDREFRPTRHAGRGGMGAVMGSKGLKAIVIDPSGCKKVPLADADGFKLAAKKFSKILAEHPVTGAAMPQYGTPNLINVINEAGALPTRNYREGNFEGAEKISGETLREIIKERKGLLSHGCMAGCIIRCSAIYNDKDGAYLTKRPEYETLCLWGSNCGIDDPDAIARIDRACDDLGADTIETGSAVAVAMEGKLIPFGDAKGAEKLMDEMRRLTPLGRILLSGAEVAGRAFGVRRVPVVKGQAMAAYDPRVIKGYGATYALSTMGADHTAGVTLGPNLMGPVFGLKPEGQANLSMNVQIKTAALLDTTGICLFANGPINQNPEALAAVVDMINAMYGLSYTPQDLDEMGKRLLTMERDFNKRAGFTTAHDRLPFFFSHEPLPPHNTVFDVPDADLDAVWKYQQPIVRKE